MNEELTIPEIAQLLGVSTTVVYRLIDRGELTPVREVKHGKQLRRYFRRSDVEAVQAKRSGHVSSEV